MAFGQSSGPPATAKQVNALLTLLNSAGHTDFRDARGPMGFTQRQANGKFTRDEADAFIEALETAEHELDNNSSPPSVVPARRRVSPVTTSASRDTTSTDKTGKAGTAGDRALEKVPTDRLAAELQRRGWVVLEP